MAKFFVGQRVRINCPESNGHGREAVVTRLNQMGWDDFDRPFIGTQIDLPSASSRCGLCVFENHELEPTLPEGSAPSVYTFHQLMESLQEAQA